MIVIVLGNTSRPPRTRPLLLWAPSIIPLCGRGRGTARAVDPTWTHGYDISGIDLTMPQGRSFKCAERDQPVDDQCGNPACLDRRRREDFDERYCRVRPRATPARCVRANHRSVHPSQPRAVLARCRVRPRTTRARGRRGTTSSSESASVACVNDRPEWIETALSVLEQRNPAAYSVRIHVACAGGHRTDAADSAVAGTTCASGTSS